MPGYARMGPVTYILPRGHVLKNNVISVSDGCQIILLLRQWRRKVPKSVGGGGGAHIHVIFVPSVKNQYKRVVFGYMVSGVRRCQKEGGTQTRN